VYNAFYYLLIHVVEEWHSGSNSVGRLSAGTFGYIEESQATSVSAFRSHGDKKAGEFPLPSSASRPIKGRVQCLSKAMDSGRTMSHGPIMVLDIGHRQLTNQSVAVRAVDTDQCPALVRSVTDKDGTSAGLVFKQVDE
jgi:hypothetical protein